MHVQLDAAGSNSLLSIMRQVTALVRRRGKFETCGEHHFCVGSPTGRRRFPQKEDSAGSNPSRRTNAHVDQRQESPPSKRGQCWFESNHGHQIRGRGGIGIRAGLKPRSLRVRSLSPAPTQKEDRHVDHAHAGSARNRSDSNAKSSFPAPSSPSAYVAQTEGRSEPALRESAMSVLVRPKGNGEVQGTATEMFS